MTSLKPAGQPATPGREALAVLAAAGRRWLTQAAAAAWAAAAVAVLLALASWTPDDPGFNRAVGSVPANWLGRPGAWLADLGYQVLGLASVLPALLVARWGWLTLRRAQAQHLARRAGAGVAAVLAACGALALAPAPAFWPLPQGLGGVLGDGLVRLAAFASEASAPLLALTAAVLALLALAAFGYAAAVPVSALGAVLRLRWAPARLISGAGPAEPAARVRRRRRVRQGRRAAAEVQPTLALAEEQAYAPPPLDLLHAPRQAARRESEEALKENARRLEAVLQDFGVRGQIIGVRPGPVVTLYELTPAPGIKTARVIGLADDIARSMSAVSARVAVVPGRNVIGIELPNARRETVYLRELLGSAAYENADLRLPLALGKDIGGAPVVRDLARMPHLLIAGTTGAGKSVGINTMILSLLHRLSPAQCRLIMIDPKMLELSAYNGIAHLLTPVVTEPRAAVAALKWAVREMEERYRSMAKLEVRHIDSYNQRLREAQASGTALRHVVQTGFDPDTGAPVYEEETVPPTPLPYIVVLIDEMADLMMVAGREIEGAVQRLAQMARAAGIHLIAATQRPSVDVVTGTIKANFPTRISFQVTSKVDSRTVLDEQGAEQLLGLGDMLYMAGGARLARVHGPFVSDEEVAAAVDFLKRPGELDYRHEITACDDPDANAGAHGASGGDDLYAQAVAVVSRDRRVSTSYVQRKLQIGYNRAARLVERMEEAGVISAANHAGKREVLAQNPDS